MPIVNVQYNDDNGNPLPVYVSREINTIDEWWTRNDFKVKLERTITCSNDCIMQVCYYGDYWQWLGPEYPAQGAAHPGILAFFVRGSGTKYLYIHDDVTTYNNGIPSHYSYDYQYIMTWDPLNDPLSSDSSELIEFIINDGMFQETYYSEYFPDSHRPYGILPYGSDSRYYWVLDPDFNNPTQQTGLTKTAYWGLYDQGWGIAPNSWWLQRCLYLNVAVSSPGAGGWWSQMPVDDGGSVVRSDVLDRLTHIYKLVETTSTNEYEAIFWGGVCMALSNHFCNIYLPSPSQINEFHKWLWDGSLSTLIDKMFQDPMEGFISYKLVKFPIQPESLDSFVLGNIECDDPLLKNQIPITTQIIHTLSCGEVQVPEYYNNALDYSDTTWELYLPYIGFVPLNASEITGASVSVSYKIDILTGTCCATVSVTKNNVNLMLYTYSGNCAFEIPISSASYQAATASLIGTVGATAAALGSIAMTGGVSAPLAVAAIGGGVNTMRQFDTPGVKRSGCMSANAGFLAWHKPYLVAHRPLSAMATNYEQYEGFPTNQLALLSNCSGFTRIKECHLGSMTCTEEEKLEIERLLKQGVIL